MDDLVLGSQRLANGPRRQRPPHPAPCVPDRMQPGEQTTQVAHTPFSAQRTGRSYRLQRLAALRQVSADSGDLIGRHSEADVEKLAAVEHAAASDDSTNDRLQVG